LWSQLRYMLSKRRQPADERVFVVPTGCATSCISAVELA
jgi:hypothetical protein